MDPDPASKVTPARQCWHAPIRLHSIGLFGGSTDSPPRPHSYSQIEPLTSPRTIGKVGMP